MPSFIRRFKRARPSLGTLVEITIEHRSEEIAHSAMNLAFAEVQRLEKIFSRFDSESELSDVHRDARGSAFEVSPELFEVLSLGAALETRYPESFRLMPECMHAEPCYELKDRSVRLFQDCAFDLGGIAKGYIVDQTFTLLEKTLPDSPFLINAGGDIRGKGSHALEVRIPGRGGGRRYALTLHNSAIATSSLLGKLSEVGEASANFPTFWRAQTASAAVIAENCAYADAFTKVALFSNAVPPSPAKVYRFDEQGELAS